MEKGFNAWYKMPKMVVSDSTNEETETIVYVGCVHGGDEKFIKMLWKLSEKSIDCLIFLGDFIGTPKFEILQKLFYNYVTNHSREILKDNNNEVSDEDLLNYVGTKAPEDGLTLKQGYLRLFAYEQELEGVSLEEINEKSETLSDQQIALEIRRLSEYAHYGHYASNLSLKAKQTLAAGLKDNAEKILEPIMAMMDEETEVIMLEGNWDARAPIDFVSGKPTAIPLPKEQRLFRVADYMAEKGITFLSKLLTLETQTVCHIFAPFDAIINAPKTDLSVIKEEVERARKANKSIILAGHGEPNWKIHNLTADNPIAKGEHAQLIEGYNILIKEFRPNQIVYDHMHDRIINENKEIVDANWKYLLEIDGDIISLVEDPERIGQSDNQIIANYIPFREVAIKKKNDPFVEVIITR